MYKHILANTYSRAIYFDYTYSFLTDTHVEKAQSVNSMFTLIHSHSILTQLSDSWLTCPG